MTAQRAPDRLFGEIACALEERSRDAVFERPQIVHRLERQVVEASRRLVDGVGEHGLEGKLVPEPGRQRLEGGVRPQRVGLGPGRVVRVEQQRAVPSAFLEGFDQSHGRVLVIGVVVEQRVRCGDQFRPHPVHLTAEILHECRPTGLEWPGGQLRLGVDPPKEARLLQLRQDGRYLPRPSLVERAQRAVEVAQVAGPVDRHVADKGHRQAVPGADQTLDPVVLAGFRKQPAVVLAAVVARGDCDHVGEGCGVQAEGGDLRVVGMGSDNQHPSGLVDRSVRKHDEAGRPRAPADLPADHVDAPGAGGGRHVQVAPAGRAGSEGLAEVPVPRPELDGRVE